MSNPNIWSPGTAIDANSSVKFQDFTATANQTLFTIPNNAFTYAVGTSSLMVFVSGVAQRPGIDFFETSSNSFTLATPVAAGTIVLAMAMVEVSAVNVFVSSSEDATLRTDLASSTGSELVSYSRGTPSAGTRTLQAKLDDMVSVKDFGAVGTANIANEAADTAAFTAAMATGRNVFVPEGTYYVSETINIGYGQILQGAGRAKTRINYSGSGTGIYMGSSAPISLIFWCELHDLTISCSNRASTVVGVELENCVMFSVSNVTSFGSGSPNSSVPAERVLYGSGIYLHNNTIIGSIRSCETRLWQIGFFLDTDLGNQSYWTAGIVFDGQCYTENNMRGVVVGNPTTNLYTGVAVVFRDMLIQGNYTTGLNINSGDNTVVDACYFEGNANYDVAVGSPSGSPTPIGVKIINCAMNSENIGVTPYGNFPYIAKVFVDRGTFTTIRDNNMSISTAIPLILLQSTAASSNISGNRLNSTIAAHSRISDGSQTTITADNYPEKARVALGTITRTLSADSGTVAYTGLGFKPTSIEFVGSVETVNERTVGWTGITNGGILNRCMTTDATGANTISNDCIKLIRSTAADYQAAVLTTFDTDGFTLIWTKTGSPPGNELKINYIARR